MEMKENGEEKKEMIAMVRKTLYVVTEMWENQGKNIAYLSKNVSEGFRKVFRVYKPYMIQCVV